MSILLKLGVEISFKLLKLTEYQPFKVGHLNQKYHKINEIKVFDVTSHKQFFSMQVYLLLLFMLKIIYGNTYIK